MIMKLIKGQRVLIFILAVIISTVIIMNLVYPMLFGNRDSVLSLASTQHSSGIPEGQSEIKKLQPLVAGTHGLGHNGIYVEE